MASMVAMVTTMVSPALAPTWKIRAGVAAVEQVRRRRTWCWVEMASISVRSWVTSAWAAVRASASASRFGGLDGEVTHALQHGVDLVQGAFCGLHDRDAVLGVAGGLVRPPTCGAQALADHEAGGVVGGPVDAEARGELLERLAHAGRCVADRLR